MAKVTGNTAFKKQAHLFILKQEPWDDAMKQLMIVLFYCFSVVKYQAVGFEGVRGIYVLISRVQQ